MQGCRADAFLLALQLFLGATGSGDDAEGEYGHTDITNSYIKLTTALGLLYKELYALSVILMFSLLIGNQCIIHADNTGFNQNIAGQLSM